MTGFKEQAQKDLEEVFLDLDEFAELHRIEDAQISVVMDNDHLTRLKKGQVIGLVEADILLMGREEDFSEELEPGSLINIDGRELIIVKSGRDMGLIEIALRQNRMG